ncbi:long-chain fatty acid transport protein [Geothermobacter ehrlichii]|uniref:Long-chain fatty acid transport protein n=1 Tax=Geothermobacter ehrlichii TaxID=213224 RepID=A0A5D3WPW7_9BACT|nr:outer membrane protein transport protein [Geothermobacter ehrlichii]TYP00267.1 long-chain fatty acid transport protein [Geothermobacter ehrlichii]
MRIVRRIVVALFVLVCMAGSAYGSGFAIIEQSVSGLGNAFAGGAAVAEDATTIFFNPAGITRIKGQQVVVGMHIIYPQADFSGTAQTSALLGSVPITGSGKDGGESAFVPNLYYVYNPENSPWAFGLGINAPFGLVTEWDRNWIGRYHAVKSDVETININPVVACKVDDHLSVAVGASAQRIDAELSSAVDFGSILAASAVPGAVPTQQDGFSVLEADDWAFTFNVGVLYEFDEDSRIGAHYRSQVNYEAKGTAEFSYDNVPAGFIPILQGAGFVNQDASADINLPASFSLSGYHRFSPSFAVMADATLTFWSSFDELRVKFANGVLPDSVTTENWDNNWRLSLGGVYTVNDSLDLRFGVAFDETPIPGAEYRTPRIPGEDRYWVAVGAGYRFSDALSLDFGYTHLFVPDAKINKLAGTDPTGENFFRGDLVGEFENSVDIASLQLNWNF